MSNKIRLTLLQRKKLFRDLETAGETVFFFLCTFLNLDAWNKM